MTAHTIQHAANRLGLTQAQLWTLLYDVGATWRDRNGDWRASQAWKRRHLLTEHYRQYQQGPVAHWYTRLKVTEAGLIELWSALDHHQVA